MSRTHSFQAMNYPPWIGSTYGSKDDLRLLVIGRSYYDARYRDRTITDYISDLSRDRVDDIFFTTLEQVLSGKRHWKSGLGGKLKLDRKKFWNSLCFHQYIQGILPDGYSPVSRQMWKESQEIYKEVILTLRPELVVMTGEDVYDNMPTLGGRQGREYSWQGGRMKTWLLNPGKAECRIARLPHPRDTSFNIEVWKELFFQFATDFHRDHR
ncbi:MAG: hypothetical protein PQJ50_13295 [Spirochaetales bacterium]|nr:hypothetical protein [Spirochaetales bacterium]